MVPTPAILAIGGRLLPPTLPLDKQNVQRPTAPWPHEVVSIAGDTDPEAVWAACHALAQRRNDRVVVTGRLPQTSDVGLAYAQALDDLTALRSLAAPSDAYRSSQLLVARTVAQLPHQLRQLLARRFERESDDTLHVMWVFLMRNRHVATVANALNVHQNTLRYQVERLERRTGMNLHDTRSIVEATLSLFALRMASPARFPAEMPLWAP